MPSLEFEGLEVSVYRSEKDGSLVVDISGPGDEDCGEGGIPRLRVWLNEGRLYEHPPGEPFAAVLVGNLTAGFRAVGPFEDFEEATQHCVTQNYCDSTWMVSLNSPHADEKDYVG